MLQFLSADKFYMTDPDDGDRTERFSEIRKKLAEEPKRAKGFLLLLSENPNNQVEILESKYLTRKYFSKEYYAKKTLSVIGFAGSAEEARTLLLKMTNDTLSATGNADIKNYLTPYLEV